MLDVAQYWNGEENHPQYETSCSISDSGHPPHHIRTQNMDSPELAPSGLGSGSFQVSGMRDLTFYVPQFVYDSSYSLGTTLSAIRESHASSTHNHSTATTGFFGSGCSVQAHTFSPASFSSHASPPHVDDTQYQSMDDNMDGGYNEMAPPSEPDYPTNVLNVISDPTCAADRLNNVCPQDNLVPTESQPGTLSHGPSPPNTVGDPLSPSSSGPPLTLLPSSAVIPSPVTASNAPSPPRSASYYRSPPRHGSRASVPKQRTDPDVPRRLNANLSVTSE